MSTDPQDPTQEQAEPQPQPDEQSEQPQPEQPAQPEVAPETPTPDSALQTPLPDQEISHSSVDQQDAAIESAVSAPRLSPQEFEDKKQADLAAQRAEHNRRTGGGEVKSGEFQEALDTHNERTGGSV